VLTEAATRTGAITLSGAVDLGNTNRTLTVNTNATLSGVVGGIGGGLTKAGNGTLTLSNANTYTGGTTISAGTLELGNGGSVAGNITNNATLSLNRTGSSTLSNVISGTGALTKSGNGTLTLSSTNTYGGNSTVSNGTLVLATNGSLRFVIGGSGTNNAVFGSGTTAMNGRFAFDLASASTNTNATWTIVAGTLTNTYGTDFLVTGFSGSGGNWTKTTNGVTYQFVQSTGVLSVLGSTPVSAYDSWLTNYSLSGTDAVGTADPDNDGFNNNMEFAFGTIPTAGSPALLRTATSGGQFVISWLQRIDSSSNYKVEEATDLVADSWVTSSARVQSGSGATPPDGYEWKQISVTPTGKKFYRVQATIAP
jgi:autotransporter-associated beta strand protein